MIRKVMILRWKQNMVGILSLQANAPNVAPRFHECGYHQSNGAVDVVAGKMIFNKNLLRKFLFVAIAPNITTFDIANRI